MYAIVRILSIVLQEFVVRSLKEIGWRRNGVWIGATDMHEEGNWNWVSGIYEL